MLRVLKHRHRLPREVVVDALSISGPAPGQADRALSTIHCRGLDWMALKEPFPPKPFCDAMKSAQLESKVKAGVEGRCSMSGRCAGWVVSQGFSAPSAGSSQGFGGRHSGCESLFPACWLQCLCFENGVFNARRYLEKLLRMNSE